MKVLEKVAKALSRNYGITVRFKGTKAHTDYKSITLPMLPEDLDENDEAKVRGYCDHEIGHLLETDPEVTKLAYTAGSKVKRMRGLLEDFRIERGIAGRYIGTKVNMERTAQLLVKENDHNDMKHIMTKLWIEGRRKVNGYEFKGVPSFEQDVKNAFGDDIFERMVAMGSGKANAMDALNLARQMVKDFEDKKEQQQQEQPEDADDDDKQQGNQGGQDDTGTDERDESESDGGAGSDSEADDDTDGDLDDGDDSTGGAGAGDNESADTDGDAGGDAGNDQGVIDGDDGDPADGGKLTIDDINSDIGGWDDAMNNLQRDVENLSTEALENGEFMPYTKDYDQIETISDAATIGDYNLLKDQLGKLNSTKGKIARLFLTRQISRWHFDKEEGQINTRKLAGVKAGNRTIFKEKHVAHDMDTAISILCDCSGSMGSHGVRNVMCAVTLMLETLKATKIQTEILGFTTTGRAVPGAPNDGTLSAEQWTRIEGIVTYIIKEFAEPFSAKVKRRIAAAPDVTRRNNNADADSLLVAAERILRTNKKRKIIFVLSDGNPNCYGSNKKKNAQLKKVVKDLERIGVEVVGIGMGHSVKTERFYPKHIKVDDTDKIVETMYRELKRLLRVK